MDILKPELAKMNVSYQSIEVIQNKDGVIVARVFCDNRSLILKFFQRYEFAREIENYKILSSLNIPTLQLISATNRALLMEDIQQSNTYRLGTKEDLDNPQIAVLIARWYRLLHQTGYEYLKQNNTVPLYDENEVITEQNIEEMKRKTATAALPVWQLIERNFAHIKAYLNKVKRTITYNDFYHTNLIVSRDSASAMMFDYNLLGKGYAYADIRNVCYSLSPKAQKAFCMEYGQYDAFEKALDDVVSILITLHFACQKPQFPSWANFALADLNSNYMNKVNRLLSYTK